MLLLFNFIALICSSTRANNEEIEFSTGADLPHPNLVPVQPPPPLPTDLAMTEWRHHVFLNFRGPDVRHSFSDHLYSALVMKGIKAFRDDRDLPRGENITEAILRAIEESKMSIVVLSRGYASSEWCLDELVKIMQTMREKKGRHYAFPVFYKITPDQVSDLSSGCYKDQFDRHKRRFSYHRVDSWRQALTSIADISGWILQMGRSEAEMVENIANSILWKVHEMAMEPRNQAETTPTKSNKNKNKNSRQEFVPEFPPPNCTSPPRPPYQRLKFMKPSISAQGKKTVIIPKSVAQQEIWELSLVAQQLCTSTSTTGTPTQTVSLILKEANKLWTNGNKIDVKELGRGGKLGVLYIFNFSNPSTRDQVLESSPWCIANTTFVMRKWQPNMQFSDNQRLTTIPVWVRLVGVPVEYMTAQGLSYIASALGNPLYMDRATTSRSHLAFEGKR
ncbi:Disease resistance protein RPV1 [Linum perenne]